VTPRVRFGAMAPVQLGTVRDGDPPPAPGHGVGGEELADAAGDLALFSDGLDRDDAHGESTRDDPGDADPLKVLEGPMVQRSERDPTPLEGRTPAPLSGAGDAPVVLVQDPRELPHPRHALIAHVPDQSEAASGPEHPRDFAERGAGPKPMERLSDEDRVGETVRDRDRLGGAVQHGQLRKMAGELLPHSARGLHRDERGPEGPQGAGELPGPAPELDDRLSRPEMEHAGEQCDPLGRIVRTSSLVRGCGTIEAVDRAVGASIGDPAVGHVGRTGSMAHNGVVRGNLFMGAGLAGSMAEGSIERTLVLVKPDGVRRGLVGEIVGRLERKGLKLVAARLVRVTPELADRHYAEHKGKPFFPGLVAHITSAPVFAMAVEGRTAIGVVRLLIGATNPQTAAPGTVRGDLALAMTSNLIHASDSPESAARELALYFTKNDYLSYERVGLEYQ